MAKKKVFISFDYDNDKHYKNLMTAWDAHPSIEFSFADKSSHEINSDNVSVVKASLTKKINSATYTFVIVGKYANSPHVDKKLIGFKNWINFEISRSKSNKNKIVAIKLDKGYSSPDELLGAGASWAYTFSREKIIKAIEDAT